MREGERATGGLRLQSVTTAAEVRHGRAKSQSPTGKKQAAERQDLCFCGVAVSYLVLASVVEKKNPEGLKCSRDKKKEDLHKNVRS